MERSRQRDVKRKSYGISLFFDVRRRVAETTAQYDMGDQED